MVLSAARLQQDKAAQLQPNMASTTAALLQRHPHHLSVGVSICQSVRFLLLTWRVPALCMIDLGEIFAVNYQPFPAVATWPGAQILTQPATLQHCMQLCRQPGRLEYSAVGSCLQFCLSWRRCRSPNCSRAWLVFCRIL